MRLLLQNGAIILTAFAAFAGVHSLTAGRGLKDRLAERVDPRLVEGWFRLAYNVVSALTLLPVLGLIVALPDRVLYDVGRPWSLLLRAVQVTGLLGLAGALFVTDVWRFAGLRQAAAYLRGEPLPLPQEALQLNGMYRLVRHPLYFFSLLALWPAPTLSVNGLWFNVAATVYFIAGSLIEEGRLVRTYGDAYREYQQRVSWLLPLPRRRAERA